MEEIRVKQETIESPGNNIGDSTKRKNITETLGIGVDSSDVDSSTFGNRVTNGKKSRVLEGHSDKSKKSGEGVVLPAGFLDPLPRKDVAWRVANKTGAPAQGCKQFWKAGDFEQGSDANCNTDSGGPPSPQPDPEWPSDSTEEEPALHPWLHFDHQTFRERLVTLMRRQFEGSRTICWTTMQSLCLEERAKAMIGPVWERFFEIRQPVYRELCYEFFSTYHFQTPVSNLTYDYTLTFRLGGVGRHMSIAEFGKRMGLYMEEELQTPLLTEAIVEFPEGLSAAKYWPKIGDGVYNARKTKSTTLRDPLLRILHRAIVHSINGRKESTGVVTMTDMFYLYCFTAPATCNVAYMLASYLYSITTKKVSSSICGGSFITQLAASYDDILTADPMENMLQVLPTRLIDSVVLQHMGVIKELHPGGFQLVDGQGQPWPSMQHHQDHHEGGPEEGVAHVLPHQPIVIEDPQGGPSGARWEQRWERMVAHQQWVADALLIIAEQHDVKLPSPPALRSPTPET